MYPYFFYFLCPLVKFKYNSFVKKTSVALILT